VPILQGVTYYDGQGFLVKKSLKVNSALELKQRIGLRANRNHDGAESRRLLQGQQHEI